MMHLSVHVLVCVCVHVGCGREHRACGMREGTPEAINGSRMNSKINVALCTGLVA